MHVEWQSPVVSTLGWAKFPSCSCLMHVGLTPSSKEGSGATAYPVKSVYLLGTGGHTCKHRISHTVCGHTLLQTKCAVQDQMSYSITRAFSIVDQCVIHVFISLIHSLQVKCLNKKLISYSLQTYIIVWVCASVSGWVNDCVPACCMVSPTIACTMHIEENTKANALDREHRDSQRTLLDGELSQFSCKCLSPLSHLPGINCVAYSLTHR